MTATIVPPILAINNLVSGYGKLAVLHDVSLSLREGEMLAVIGPNGAGKSTLMKTIMNLVNTMKGEILFEGKDIAALETQRIAGLGIGYVPQTQNVFGSLTVHENLTMSCNLLPRDEHATAVDAIYERFPRLKERRRQQGRSLSGGERQMLAIGSALLAKPRLLILDEPVSGLSPHMTDEVARGISRINDGGVTVIWVVEENPHQVIGLSDSVCIMGTGTVRLHLPADDVIKADNFKEMLLGI
ncbi:ABC transporter ATP-binding protein (plasmid) [Rhizobium sp. TRM96647]|uniref:ABC transporter ATP-binding protein n=1 Tax=unclassified Rhizobium TaxID=2613769 RepID=UPI0021E6EC84|nr:MULTISPECIES: ABC transporter ATP-binding protein [unclassified Rhizobium]MCV3735164.1 ABC transporter ATP-binding protein [Rhizobium sp. TRM96647]MCV3758072.1 ABC transporter ATP-binding protein [Rhizobium sp. TRM96650]